MNKNMIMQEMSKIFSDEQRYQRQLDPNNAQKL